MSDIERQRRRLTILEDAEKEFLRAITVYHTMQYDIEDADLYRDTVRLELRLKKRIAGVSATIMGMQMKEEIA